MTYGLGKGLPNGLNDNKDNIVDLDERSNDAGRSNSEGTLNERFSDGVEDARGKSNPEHFLAEWLLYLPPEGDANEKQESRSYTGAAEAQCRSVETDSWISHMLVV